MPSDIRPIRVLFVCLGNICRSPTAEGVLRHLAALEAPHLNLEVDSAGTADYHIGNPPDPRSQRAALKRGIDLGSMRARQVTAEDFRLFDFILAMDAQNLRRLEARKPRDCRAELGLFLSYVPQCGLREVPDPYYGGEAEFEQVLDLTAAAARGFIEALNQRAQKPI